MSRVSPGDLAYDMHDDSNVQIQVLASYREPGWRGYVEDLLGVE